MMDNEFIYRIFKGSVPIKKIMHGFSVVYEWIEGVIEALVSGVPPVILEESTGQAMIDCKIYGNSVQDGTSAEIQSVGDRSKNLINWDYLLSDSSITKVENGYTSNVYYHNFFTTTHPDFIKHIKSVLKPNVTYTLSRVWEGVTPGSAGTTGNIIFAKNGGVTLVECGYWGKLISTTFSLTQEEIDSIAVVYVYFAIGSGYNTISELQLTEGDEVLPYAPYGYKIPIEVRGKNMFDVNGDINRDINGNTPPNQLHGNFIAGDNQFLIKTSTQATHSFGQFINVEVGKTYTVSLNVIEWGNCPTLEVQAHAINPNANLAQIRINAGENTMTFSFTATTDTVHIAFTQTGISYGDNGLIIGDVQVEEGNTAAEYEPYRKEITYIYLDEPLAEGEYIDFKNQKLVKADGEANIALPELKTHRGTNIISVDTEIPPSNVEIQYYKIIN